MIEFSNYLFIQYLNLSERLGLGTLYVLNSFRHYFKVKNFKKQSHIPSSRYINLPNVVYYQTHLDNLPLYYRYDST